MRSVSSEDEGASTTIMLVSCLFVCVNRYGINLFNLTLSLRQGIIISILKEILLEF